MRKWTLSWRHSFSSPFSGTFFQWRRSTGGSRSEYEEVFVPFLGDFFSILDGYADDYTKEIVFVPFLGDFFSITYKVYRIIEALVNSFRPLSRGLFFNWQKSSRSTGGKSRFSSPFSGTFFQLGKSSPLMGEKSRVFVPFLGDFFSMKQSIPRSVGDGIRFRPLSRGLFFNTIEKSGFMGNVARFSSPFSGTFFQ